MSTRSRIGIEAEDGTVRSIYCHFDGYLDGVGRTLVEHYPSLEAAEGLLGLGDLSQLGERVEACVAYHRDRGEAWEHNRPESHASAEGYRREGHADGMIAYVYLLRDGGWLVSGPGGGEWRPLPRHTIDEGEE